MEEAEMTPEQKRKAEQRKAEQRAATQERLARETAERLTRVKARNPDAVAGISVKVAQRFVHATNPEIAGALRRKRERQRDQYANRVAARQLTGRPPGPGRSKPERKGATVTAAVSGARPTRAVDSREVKSFTQVLGIVGADRKWFAAGANQ